MLSSNPPVAVPLPFANSGTKNTIPTASQIGITAGAASLTDGFPPLTFTPISAGGVPAFGADFNGILNMISQTIQWVQGGGQFGYNSTFQTAVGGYPKGALLLRGDLSGYWFNTTDGNTTDPDTGGAGWIPCGNSSQIASITLSGSTVTLTALQAASPIIVLTGTISANLNVIFPAWAAAEWTILNETTGSFTVTCKTSAGTGIVVAQGGGASLYSDGTNVLQASATQVGLATQSQHAVQFGQVSGIVGSVRNLKCSNAAASTSLTYTADEVIVESALGGLRYCLGSFNETMNGATTGLGGLDTGALAASTSYSVYAAYTSTGAAGIFAQLEPAGGATSVYGGTHLPAGVIATALIGVVMTNASSQFAAGLTQLDRQVFFPNVAAVSSSSQITSPTAVSLSSIVPKCARLIQGTYSVTAASGSSNPSVNIYATSSISGFSIQNAGVTNGSGTSNQQFSSFPLVTPQEIWWTAQVTGGTFNAGAIGINGYTF